ncbi:13192_t:CDS:2, partial [Gigaspora margarita]
MSSSSYCTAFWIILLFNIILNHVEDIDLNAEMEKEDFDDDKTFDEFECYISEKLANKEINMLAWWKIIK